MKKFHSVTDIHFKNNELILTVDGVSRHFSFDRLSPVLRKASEAELNNYILSPSGYGIHWPELDEDISIDGLLGILHRPRSKQQAA